MTTCLHSGIFLRPLSQTKGYIVKAARACTSSYTCNGSTGSVLAEGRRGVANLSRDCLFTHSVRTWAPAEPQVPILPCNRESGSVMSRNSENMWSPTFRTKSGDVEVCAYADMKSPPCGLRGCRLRFFLRNCVCPRWICFATISSNVGGYQGNIYKWTLGASKSLFLIVATIPLYGVQRNNCQQIIIDCTDIL